MHSVLLVVAAFLASAVEMVEALTIVLAVGVTRGWRSAGWGVAAAVGGLAVIVAGVIVHAPLTRVPENTLKFGVGVMLTAFGIFWSAEGAGITWPGADLALLGLIAFVVVLSFSLVALERRSADVPEMTAS